MREKSVRELFYCIDEFMKLQGSPSASFMDGFPVIARLLPIRLQWYRKDAERVFRETLQSVTVVRLRVYIQLKLASECTKTFSTICRSVLRKARTHTVLGDLLSNCQSTINSLMNNNISAVSTNPLVFPISSTKPLSSRHDHRSRI